MSERYISEAEALLRAHACAGQILEVSEKLRGRPFSAGRYKALFEKTQRSILKYVARQFVIVYDQENKAHKGPR